MGRSLDSKDDMIEAAFSKGMLNIIYTGLSSTSTTTAATATSGGITARRFPNTYTIPSVGSGVNGYWLDVNATSEDVGTMIVAGLEYAIGTLTVSGNSFSGSASLPSSKLYRHIGTNYNETTASLLTMVVVSTTLTATTPVLTITYTDQGGNASQTATMTLPTNAVAQSAFLLTPHLATGDTGVRSVTNLSISTGSAGVIDIYGILPVGVNSGNALASGVSFMSSLNKPWPLPLAEAGEALAFYRFGSTGSYEMIAHVRGIPDIN